MKFNILWSLESDDFEFGGQILKFEIANSIYN